MKKSKVQIFRLISQLFFLMLVTIAGFRHQILGGGPEGSPPVDSICPFGAIESLYKLVATGKFIDKIDWSALVLLIGAIISTIIVGRYFCGWVCALGTMQELFAKLDLKIFKKRFEINARLDKSLRYLKYILLLVILYFTWKTGRLVIRPYDPFAAYSHIPAGFEELWSGFAIGFSILIVSLIASMFYDRFFCKYACPLGAFLGIISKISIFKIKRENSTCIHCDLCNKKCPVNINVSGINQIDSAECISCLECVTVCPTNKGTLKTHIKNKAIKPITIAVLGLLIYLGTAGIGHISGYWKTDKTLEEIAKTDDKLAPENIKGFMTLKEISDIYKIDIGVLYNELGITKEQVPQDTRIKKISELLASTDKKVDEEVVRETVAKILESKK